MAEIRETLRLTALELEEANRVLGRLQDRLDELEGRRGTPRFYGAVNMGGYRVTNAGASSAATDAVIKSQLDNEADRLQTMIEGVWPVGSIYTSVVSTDPAILLGFGTWEAFGAGKFLVGLDSSDASFDTAMETGGSKTKDISHAHNMGNHTHSIAHTHADAGTLVLAAGAVYERLFAGNSGTPSTNDTSTAGSATQDILPPYMVVYFWKRTA